VTAAQQLLDERFDGMAEPSPLDSVHALDLAGLRATDLTFWSAWQGEKLLGCGALKALDDTQAEVRSMRTASGHLREEVAAQMLAYIIEQACERGHRLSLETRSSPAFAPALALYARLGFVECAPFFGDREDRFSLYRTLCCDAAPGQKNRRGWSCRKKTNHPSSIGGNVN
jgi:putative acetyltransferase